MGNKHIKTKRKRMEEKGNERPRKHVRWKKKQKRETNNLAGRQKKNVIKKKQKRGKKKRETNTDDPWTTWTMKKTNELMKPRAY